MDIWPIDFNKSVDEIARWHDAWRVERFGSNSSERYYNTSDNGRYLYGVAEGESLNDEKANCEKVLELLLRIKGINDKLSGKVLSQHLQWREREQLKEERETLYKAFLDEVQAEQPEPQQVPPKLETKQAKRYFDKAIGLGLMDRNYKWLKGLQMLACFAYSMSIRLELGKGVNGDGRPRISWKPFETLFSVDKGKLRLNYNDIQKTGQQPKESYLIDRVFE